MNPEFLFFYPREVQLAYLIGKNPVDLVLPRVDAQEAVLDVVDLGVVLIVLLVVQGIINDLLA